MTLTEPDIRRLTNADLIKMLRKPGKVFAPVLIPSDVMHVEVVKADIIHMLGHNPADEMAPFIHVGMTAEGNHWLDCAR